MNKKPFLMWLSPYRYRSCSNQYGAQKNHKGCPAIVVVLLVKLLYATLVVMLHSCSIGGHPNEFAAVETIGNWPLPTSTKRIIICVDSCG
jgi:hypothetical protein